MVAVFVVRIRRVGRLSLDEELPANPNFHFLFKCLKSFSKSEAFPILLKPGSGGVFSEWFYSSTPTEFRFQTANTIRMSEQPAATAAAAAAN